MAALATGLAVAAAELAREIRAGRVSRRAAERSVQRVLDLRGALR